MVNFGLIHAAQHAFNFADLEGRHQSFDGGQLLEKRSCRLRGKALRDDICTSTLYRSIITHASFSIAAIRVRSQPSTRPSAAPRCFSAPARAAAKSRPTITGSFSCSDFLPRASLMTLPPWRWPWPSPRCDRARPSAALNAARALADRGSATRQALVESVDQALVKRVDHCAPRLPVTPFRSPSGVLAPPRAHSGSAC
jgi:hypothetical protein